MPGSSPDMTMFGANHVRHDRLRSFRARTLSLKGAIRMADRREGPRAVVDFGHAACRHVRACRLTLIKARTATRFATPGDNALLGRMVRAEIRVAVRLKKPAAGLPARAS
jgi:hypothetical protein